MNEDAFAELYQTGKSSVEHSNIDASGEDHPFGSEPKEFEAEMRTLIRKVADELYESWDETFREYLANAETATLQVQEWVENREESLYSEFDLIVGDDYSPQVDVVWDKKADRVVISDNGIGMSGREVDVIFRQIGRSTARDDGSKSGNFGQGALSFVKYTGLDNAMIMTSHSRLNDDNASYYVTLAGVEPIRGSLDDDQYGTEFQLTAAQDKSDVNVRTAIEKYAQWMRVPVRYEERGTDGSIVFQEDYGDKSLYESYHEKRACLEFSKEDAFRAYCSPDADSRTLLLSMDIDRNSSVDDDYSPFPFDVRLLDESGKVIESSNGNEGLIPCTRSDYQQMLLEARPEYVTDGLLNSKDFVAQEIVDSDDDSKIGSYVVGNEEYDDLMSGEVHAPPLDYIPASAVDDSDVPGQAKVIFGPHEGRTVVSDEEWDELDAGRASSFVIKTELEEYDVESGTGDLCLPEPTSDRARLQQNDVFWKYISKEFANQFNNEVKEIRERIDLSDDWRETIMNLDEEDLVVSPSRLK